jgi:hypothetical protein
MPIPGDAERALPHPGAPRGDRNGRWRGGFYTAEAQAERRRLRALIRQMRATMDELL